METIGTLENRFGDHHLAIGYRNKLKTRIEYNGEPMQEFATAIKQLTHCAFPSLHKDHVCRGSGKTFGDKLRD
jgi:hypothetical protein